MHSVRLLATLVTRSSAETVVSFRSISKSSSSTFHLLLSLQLWSQTFNPSIWYVLSFPHLFVQILNRWQGSKTDKSEVAKISEAIKKQEDSSVCLLNYKKSGETFINQFFICPVYTSDKKLAYYLGELTWFFPACHWCTSQVDRMQH